MAVREIAGGGVRVVVSAVSRAALTAVVFMAIVAGAGLWELDAAAGPPEADQLVLTAATGEGPCGDQPCPPAGEDPPGEGPCGDQPCPPAGEDPPGEGPCGDQPCPPAGEDPPGEGPCGDEPCPPAGEDPPGEGPCGDQPCPEPGEDPPGEGPCGDRPCPPAGEDAAAAPGGEDADPEKDADDDPDEGDGSSSGPTPPETPVALSRGQQVHHPSADGSGWPMAVTAAAAGAAMLAVSVPLAIWRRKRTVGPQQEELET